MLTNRKGTSLFELLITLSVVATLLSLITPRLSSGMNGLAVRAARESAFGLFSRARVVAVQEGGASIQVDALEDQITLRSASGEIVTEERFRDGDVDLVIEGADSVTLRYDAHGLGRMMSRTIAFHAQQARAGLTVSSFGRVRRW